jgi:hypothetical protein
MVSIYFIIVPFITSLSQIFLLHISNYAFGGAEIVYVYTMRLAAIEDRKFSSRQLLKQSNNATRNQCPRNNSTEGNC